MLVHTQHFYQWPEKGHMLHDTCKEVVVFPKNLWGIQSVLFWLFVLPYLNFFLFAPHLEDLSCTASIYCLGLLHSRVLMGS